MARFDEKRRKQHRASDECPALCSFIRAVAGETLFYLSRAGVCGYTGGFPSVVGQPLYPGPFSWDYYAAQMADKIPELYQAA